MMQQQTPRTTPALIPLQRLAARLQVGSTLPFDVRDAAGTLLLARGSTVADEAMRQALLASRDAGIELAQLRELQARLDLRRREAEHHFAERWRDLQRAAEAGADTAAPLLLALADLCPDRLLFALLQREAEGAAALAGLAALLSRRAGWAHERRLALLQAALAGRDAAGDAASAQLLQIAGLYLQRRGASSAAAAAWACAPSPRQAARDLFMASAGHPFAAMLVKELGLFPPASRVRLRSGEAAVVVRRGCFDGMPLAAAITDGNGHPRALPQARDTARPAFAILAPLADAPPMASADATRLLYECAQPGDS